MIAEYLDRGSLVARMEYYKEHTAEESGEHYAYSVALREIRNAHAADVAPVVRCENCRYAMWVEWAKKYSCGQVRGLLVFGDHFCAFGKREYESRPQASL
jgi:hypothetical protein